MTTAINISLHEMQPRRCIIEGLTFTVKQSTAIAVLVYQRYQIPLRVLGCIDEMLR